jgi:hypothetical protein
VFSLRAPRHVVPAVAGFVVFLFLLAVPFPAAAQEVIGISAILSSTNSSHIDTYSATEIIDPNVAFYYDAYVEGHLFQNGIQIIAEAAIGNPTAAGGLTEPLTVGDTYEIDSYHFLVAFFSYTNGGNNYFYNPYNFTGDGGGGNPSGTGFLPGGGPTYESVEFIFLGYTYVVLPTGVPSISSITPTAGSVGSSGRITLQGANLEDPFTQTTTPAIDGSGVTLTLRSVAPTQVSLDFSIAQNASTGAHHVTLSTRFGTSNAVVFNVGDPTPVVTGVSPNIWRAGSNLSVTLTGKGFGTSPTVSVSGTGVSVGAVSNPSDTQLSVGISVASNAPNETVTIQVQSNGYNGSGFVATTPGEPQSGSNTATVEAAPAPAPMIMFNGQNITGTAQNVVVGQQIALTVAGLPSGVTITSQTWAPAAIGGGPVGLGSVVGGYNASAASGQVVDPPSLSSNTPTSSGTGYGITFYWVQTGTGQYQLTYSYCLASGNCSDPGQATATFNIKAPPTVSVSPSVTSVSIGTATECETGQPIHLLVFGTITGGNYSSTGACFQLLNGTAGITFPGSVTTASPSGKLGSFLWVQLLPRISATGANSINGITAANPNLSCTWTSGLDVQYPAMASQTAGQIPTVSDTPAGPLRATDGEASRVFSATMYLMWDPAIPLAGQNSCSTATPTAASTCASIPVPLGNVSWGFSADTINTLKTQSNGTTWTLDTPACKTVSPASPSFQSSGGSQGPTYGYPKWTALSTSHCP